MEANSIDRIRSATFAVVRKGYEPQQVEAFLAKIADWLEAGGGDEARATAISREIERIGSKTSTILAAAEDSAQQLRGDAEREVSELLSRTEADVARVRSEADAYAAEMRQDADRYAAELRADADSYAEKTRTDADGYSEKTHETANANAERKAALAEQRAAEILEAAERKAKRIVSDGTKRRREIETVIGDLVEERNAAIAASKALIEKLRAANAAHAPKEGEDRFARPRELDPAERGEEVAEDGSEEPTKPVTVDPAERVEA